VKPVSKADKLFHRAVAALANGDFKRAEKLTKDILEMDAKNIEGLMLLVNIYHQSNEFEKALKPAQQIIELEPENVQQLNTLGFLYLRLQRWKEAKQCYEKIIAKPAVSPTIFLNYALALLGLNKQDKAIDQLRKAVTQSLEGEIAKIVHENPLYEPLRSLLSQIT
jgi:Tfp pilus assembly protein PilF